MKTSVWAHRGASAYRPENTLEAFALAAEMNADGVELDVHFTKDRQVVVCHDEKIDRTSNGQGAITQYTLEELRHFDFGYKFYGELRGIKIPTLDEVYSLLAPLGLTVNVEIKSADPEMPSECIKIAEKHGMENRVIYSSFNHLQLMRTKQSFPDALCGALYAFNMINPWNYASDIGISAVHPHFGQLLIFEDYVERCHARGIKVHPYTVNEKEDIEFTVRRGCDAVITNFPDRALEILQNI